MAEKIVHVPVSERPRPDRYHARTGHVLPAGSSEVFKQLWKTEEFANNNLMQIKYKKTKLMVFNPFNLY
jgi:hypothetical protein